MLSVGRLNAPDTVFCRAVLWVGRFFSVGRLDAILWVVQLVLCGLVD